MDLAHWENPGTLTAGSGAPDEPEYYAGPWGAVARFIGARMVLSMPVAIRTAGSAQALA